MKLSECNGRQRKVYLNVYHAANWIIGGLENTLEDFDKESEEYKNAEAQLNDHDELVKYIYSEAITNIYGDGVMCWGENIRSYLKDVRFCGKEWIMERVEKRVKKMGY